ncbi:uncharacterized protein LOC143269540 isoform X3 [Peromyscus maniculatus bairdii]|uniref:uncharacterized protein LOC143269540 isoform X3 n=1 Tax=Peromyscus maniculatus bairdii TaxID=230844 RepID=UPI003FD10661
MGAKQSGPAANGRTRAYSGSDLPSGGARQPQARPAETRAAESLRRQRPTASRSEGRWIARWAAERHSRQRRRRRTRDVAGARRRGRGWGRRGTAPWPATRSDVPRPAPAQYGEGD